MRWGVFVRDPRENDDGEWTERHRWDGNGLIVLADQAAAEQRAGETRHWHPEWEVEARQTDTPLPGDFTAEFAFLLPSGRQPWKQ